MECATDILALTSFEMIVIEDRPICSETRRIAKRKVGTRKTGRLCGPRINMVAVPDRFEETNESKQTQDAPPSQYRASFKPTYGGGPVKERCEHDSASA